MTRHDVVSGQREIAAGVDGRHLEQNRRGIRGLDVHLRPEGVGNHISVEVEIKGELGTEVSPPPVVSNVKADYIFALETRDAAITLPSGVT